MKPLKLSFLLILAVSVLLLSGPSVNAELDPNQDLENVWPDEHEPPSNNIETSPDTEPKPPTPLQAETLEALRAIAKQQKSAYEHYRADQKTWHSPEVYISIALFVVASIYTFFAWRQWQAISRTANLTADGIIETRKAANAAQKSAEVSEKSLTLLERAWLEIIIDPFPVNITPGAVTIHIWNTGRTPALVKIITTPTPQYIKIAPTIKIEPKPTEQLPNKTTIMANQTFQCQVNFEPMTGVESKGSWLLVHGCVLYDDQLGNRHITRFYRRSDILPDGRTGFIIAPDDPPEYNKAD